MEYGSGVGISQRLSIEKQLLREEKYIVHALKTVKEERHGLQREGIDMMCMLKEVLQQGKPRSAVSGETSQEGAAPVMEVISSATPIEAVPAPQTSSIPDDFDLVTLDDLVGNDVELNLTVPSHPFYGQPPEEEDFEELETEDDYEIEMSMLMNGGKPNE